MVLGDAVSTLETFVWILNHVSRSITWSPTKCIKLGQMTSLNVIYHLVVSVYQLVKISSLRNFGMAYSKNSLSPLKIEHGLLDTTQTMNYFLRKVLNRPRRFWESSADGISETNMKAVCIYLIIYDYEAFRCYIYSLAIQPTLKKRTSH